MIESIHDVVRTHIPPKATVLVVSKGDDSLFLPDGRRYRHFPQDDQGGYAGYYPADDAEAICQLDAVQARDGAAFLLFPRTSRWWLDHYIGLRDHLEHRYVRVVDDDACLILTPRGSG